MTAEWLNDPERAPYAWIPYIAVGITSPSADQMHAALLYKDADEGVRALHFCWHHIGRDEEAPHGYHWVEPRMRASQARSIAAHCRRVAEARTLHQVPFAFRFNDDVRFDTETAQLLGPAGQGLTCATFVLAMFATAGAKLVAASDWPARPCDAFWFERIIGLLTHNHPDHARALSEQTDAVRFRPEEVVAAAAQPTRPVAFEVALRNGRDVLGRMGRTQLACWFERTQGGCAQSAGTPSGGCRNS